MLQKLNFKNISITIILANFATKNELNAYAKLSQMTQWPTKDDPDEATTNFNAQIAT
jgi:hypothetical protein